ncbi:glucose-6-phosphate isomerase [Litorimonas haliclonae]|uniref:glucose-6-phosphate isomerase n=1 Tax=Litorimonas haliclonae TaxID=2081977 RepID=UPI0039EE5DA2
MTTKSRFNVLEALAEDEVSISELFEKEPDRLNRFVMREGPLRVDFSKQAIPNTALDALLSMAAQCDLEEWRAKLFAGEAVNTSEDRAVLHMALRGVGGAKDVQRDVSQMRQHMAAYADEIRSDGKFKNIVHIGIGGSDLGPRLVSDGFEACAEQSLTLRFAENVDGASINDAVKGLDPAETLVIIVSKSFGTQETKMNGESARAWLTAGVGAAAGDHMLAVTANRTRAIDFGIREENIFDFWDWVGGRYSVWSAVGLSLQIAYGPDVFSDFLEGAAAMDKHFRDQPLQENLPVMMALTGIWNRNCLNYSSLAVIPYSRRLRKLSAFLQQLEMESNGKRITRDGNEAGLTCPIIWGDEGTNGQHAFFQWLHQGPSEGKYGGAPVDFVAILKDHENRPDHHKALLANCFAQSEALMLGKSEDAVRQELGDRDDIDALAPQKTFPGNRPSTTITLDELSPFALGHLIALYEHKVFVQGVIWNVNSFDQWGVELGKVLATTILEEMNTDDPGNHDASTTALMGLAKT